jgi:hypothetical protein
MKGNDVKGGAHRQIWKFRRIGQDTSLKIRVFRAEIWELNIMNTKGSGMTLYVYIGKWVYKGKGKGVRRQGIKKCEEVEVKSISILSL